MSFQWATRAGALRHLRLGSVVPRPTRVSSMQNQLRRVCLAAKSRLTEPRVGPLSMIVYQQSHYFATSTESSGRRGRKPKKELTERQKVAKAKRDHRARVKELKTAALEPPKKLPITGWQIGVATLIPELKSRFANPRETMKGVVSMMKSMTPDELQAYKTQAEENKAANQAVYKSWVESYSPSQIRDANLARAQLTRILKKKVRPIKDERLVKKPLTAFFVFLKERVASGDFKHMLGRDVMPRITAEWKSMTALEKQRYQKLQAEERQRYEREHEEVYGEPPKPPRRRSRSAEEGI